MPPLDLNALVFKLIAIWNALIAILTFVGFVFTIFDLYQFRTSIIEWWKSREETKKSASLMNAANYFIAQIIQVGGEGSMIYSLSVSVDEQGGYFLNPPHKFVSIGFNRPIDLMTVMPSDFASRHGGFVVGSTGITRDKLDLASNSDICHLPLTEMRNEYFVKFIRRSSFVHQNKTERL